MDYCGPQALPHSQFLRWDRDDRDKAIVWAIRQRQTCPSCGTRPDEWDPGRGGHDHAYKAELHKCWGCDLKAKAERRFGDKAGAAGAHVVLIRNEGAR